VNLWCGSHSAGVATGHCDVVRKCECIKWSDVTVRCGSVSVSSGVTSQCGEEVRVRRGPERCGELRVPFNTMQYNTIQVASALIVVKLDVWKRARQLCSRTDCVKWFGIDAIQYNWVSVLRPVRVQWMVLWIVKVSIGLV
jgi:hypothetical protein